MSAESLPNKLVHELSGHEGPVRAVRFNSLVQCSSIKMVKVYVLHFLNTENGEYCLTCGNDRTIKLWNPHRGITLKTYKGPGQEVLDADALVVGVSNHMTFHSVTCRSHDNSRIVSGGADKVVLVLDVSTGQPIRNIRGHYGVKIKLFY